MGHDAYSSKTPGGALAAIGDHLHSVSHVAPDLANSLILTANTSSWVEGAAIEFINGGSVTAVTKPFDVHWFWVSAASANDEYQIKLYAAGVEVANFVFEKTATADPNFESKIQMPIVAAGTTMTAKLAVKSATGRTLNFKANYHTY